MLPLTLLKTAEDHAILIGNDIIYICNNLCNYLIIYLIFFYNNYYL
jgi:hypothetical protein